MEALIGGMLEAVETILLADLPQFRQELLDKTSLLQVVPETVPNDEARLLRHCLYSFFLMTNYDSSHDAVWKVIIIPRRRSSLSAREHPVTRAFPRLHLPLARLGCLPSMHALVVSSGGGWTAPNSKLMWQVRDAG